ncbi:MAG: GDSL-type esterase/lipase family protein [Verrucomicrobiae bacterium]|nr:GDSL-type esterase/lipase family protein [Verrucomicrobiae bacterium]
MKIPMFCVSILAASLQLTLAGNPPAGVDGGAVAPHVMLAQGDSAEMDLECPGDPSRLVAATIDGKSLEGGVRLEMVAANGPKNKVRLTTTPGAEPGVCRIGLKEDGKIKPLGYVDIVDKAAYGEFEAAAAKVKLPDGPVQLLFLGDSLTDRNRGFNYADKVCFWLARNHPEGVRARNAGVGGDFTVRVWDRMNGVAGVHRPTDYDGIFDPPPQFVFVFLGQNDTKVHPSTRYTLPMVSSDKFEETYRLIVQRLKEQTRARIVLLSTASLVFEVQKEKADQMRAQGKNHALFGVSELLEKFNAVIKKLADEMSLGYVDVYEPTRRHPSKKQLFVEDGVHVNNEGNRLIALEILRYFAATSGDKI